MPDYHSFPLLAEDLVVQDAGLDCERCSRSRQDDRLLVVLAGELLDRVHRFPEGRTSPMRPSIAFVAAP